MMKKRPRLFISHLQIVFMIMCLVTETGGLRQLQPTSSSWKPGFRSVLFDGGAVE